MISKIISLGDLSQRAKQLRSQGKKLVVTNGCFDILHVGHVRYLQKARALGDVLAVGVNGDSSTRELKGGGRPLNNENERAEVLAALDCVDLVSVFSATRATNFLEAAMPAIYVKGGDYNIDTLHPEERAVLENMGTEIRIIRFEPGYSTSGLIERIQNLKQ